MVSLLLGALLLQPSLPQGPAVQPGRFESEIAAYEAADRARRPRPGGIVFIGSSSIRLWKTLAEDFPGHRVVNRGFGGSVLAESTRYAPRILFPHRPRMVVLFAGTNDLASGRTPQQVSEDFRAFCSAVRKELPQARIAFIAITPAPSRASLHPQMKEANRLVQEWILTQPNMAFIDTYGIFLTKDGQPRPELFVSDQLHLNEEGYKLWRSLVLPFLPWTGRERG